MVSVYFHFNDNIRVVHTLMGNQQPICRVLSLGEWTESDSVSSCVRE
jgi:hypothetical protein